MCLCHQLLCNAYSVDRHNIDVQIRMLDPCVPEAAAKVFATFNNEGVERNPTSYLVSTTLFIIRIDNFVC